MGGVILPHPLAAAKNPAYLLVPIKIGYESARPFPIGLLGLLPSERNPLLYLTAKDIFIQHFDFLSFFDQISHLNTFLINPPRSPGEVNLRVSDDRVRITDGEGNHLPFGRRAGSAGISWGGTPLIPPPLITIPLTVREMYLETGLFLGSGGYSLGPDAELGRAINRGSLLADTEYKVIGSASLHSGIGQSATIPFQWTDSGTSADAYAALRILGFYTAAYGQVDFNMSLNTEETAAPNRTALDWSVFSLRPGSGFGCGLRLDAGLVADYGRWIWGAGVLNLLGFNHLTGVQQDSGDTEGRRVSRFTNDGLPALFTNIAYTVPIARSQLILAADVGYTAGLVSHAGVACVFDAMHVKAGLGWEGQWRFGMAWGMRFRRWWGEIALTSHETPFTGGRTFGFGMTGGTLSTGRSDT